jgi:hypothetical protein
VCLYAVPSSQPPLHLCHQRSERFCIMRAERLACMFAWMRFTVNPLPAEACYFSIINRSSGCFSRKHRRAASDNLAHALLFRSNPCAHASLNKHVCPWKDTAGRAIKFALILSQSSTLINAESVWSAATWSNFDPRAQPWLCYFSPANYLLINPLLSQRRKETVMETSLFAYESWWDVDSSVYYTAWA